MLKDRQTGDETEVDIAVTERLHDTEVIIGFECRDTSRKVDRTAVQQLVQKHLYLTNKLVIVSRNGFTGKARKLCEINGAEAITFSTASGLDWKGYIEEFSNLTFGLFDLSWNTAPLVRYSPITSAERPLQVDESTLVVFSKTGATLLLKAALQQLCRSGPLGRKVMDHWFAMEPAKRPSEYEVTATYTPEVDDPWVMVQGEHGYRVDAVDVRLLVKTRHRNFSMSPMVFKDKRILEGSVTMSDGEYAGRPIHFLVSEAENGERRGSVMFPALQSKAGSVIHEAEFAAMNASAEKK